MAFQTASLIHQTVSCIDDSELPGKYQHSHVYRKIETLGTSKREGLHPGQDRVADQ